MEMTDKIDILIAATQATIAIAVFWHSWSQGRLNRNIQRISRIQEWGNDCIEALVEAREFCLLQASDFVQDGAYTVQRSNILQRLSTLIDQGRLFYKNTHRELSDQEVFPAYRGYRPEILDPLIHAYRSISEQDGTTNQDRCERLQEWRKRFVSLLQFELRPDWLKKAQYYTTGPGGETGISVDEQDGPPEWPKGRPLP